MKEQKSIQGGSTRPPWIAFSIVATVGIVIVVAFFVAEKQGDDEREQRRAQREQHRAQRLAELQRGTACRSLVRAETAWDSQNDAALEESIKQAELEALSALDTTGILFGKPERLALYLAADLKEDQTETIVARMKERLGEAIESCQEISGS